MASKTLTGSVIGLDAELVEVEADNRPGLGNFYIVGLPDTMVHESRERVKSALKGMGISFPRGTVTVNLAPADLKKAGTLYDLPIAVAIFCNKLDIPALDRKRLLLAGELSLNGELRPIHGALSLAALARDQSFDEIILPESNANEAALIPGIDVYGAKTLESVIAHLTGQTLIKTPPRTLSPRERRDIHADFSSVRGQEQAKRALEIAAAGGHNVLMQGPPGSGKTLLAHCFTSILPPLEPSEILEVTRIWSVAGRLNASEGVVHERPFRSPHHTASGAALVGGGTIPRPGEISLAHRGVLFLDEFPEFSRQVLENLRQPLEDGIVTVTRVQQTITFPARFTLIAAMNPCPCGYATTEDHACTCTPMQTNLYRKKLSGPLLDRIDLMIEVPKVKTEKLMNLEPGEPSLEIRKRVRKARMIQIARMKQTGVLTNSELSSEMIRALFPPGRELGKLLEQAVDRFHLSARGYFRILKVARTIADLEGDACIGVAHVAEALQYRQIAE